MQRRTARYAKRTGFMNSSNGAFSHLPVLSHLGDAGQGLLAERGRPLKDLKEELESKSAHSAWKLVNKLVAAGINELPDTQRQSAVPPQLVNAGRSGAYIRSEQSNIMDRLALTHFVRHDAEVLQLGHAE